MTCNSTTDSQIPCNYVNTADRFNVLAIHRLRRQSLAFMHFHTADVHTVAATRITSSFMESTASRNIVLLVRTSCPTIATSLTTLHGEFCFGGRRD